MKNTNLTGFTNRTFSYISIMPFILPRYSALIHCYLILNAYLNFHNRLSNILLPFMTWTILKSPGYCFVNCPHKLNLSDCFYVQAKHFCQKHSAGDGVDFYRIISGGTLMSICLGIGDTKLFFFNFFVLILFLRERDSALAGEEQR